VKSVLRRIARPPLHRPDLRCVFEVLGTEYGGWPVVNGRVSRDSVVYSFGVGEDVSFDCALISKSGCQVWAFDPTPKSQAWVSGQSLPREFHFAPVGVSATDGEVTFYPPANTVYVSYSVAPGQDQTRKPIVAPVRRLSTLMAENGHGYIDVLKMDIEGFEYGVIDDLLAGTTRPQHLLVEFHHGMYGIDREKTMKAVDALRRDGYRLFYVSATGREYGFLRAPARVPGWRRLLRGTVRGGRRARRTLFEAFGSDRYSHLALNDLDRKLARHLDFRNGIFVECGANDGLAQSNTYWFERFRGWRGLLIEAVPEKADDARRNRPKAKVVNCALVANDSVGSVKIQAAGLMAFVSGAFPSKEEEARQIENAKRVQQLQTVEILDVPARPLSRVLEEAGLPRVDLFSLDVEGYECEVLKGLDISRHRPRYILVETKRLHAVLDLLAPHYIQIDQLTFHDYLLEAVDA